MTSDLDALVELLTLVHQPNPQDPSRWDIAPGKHRAFCSLIERLRATLAQRGEGASHGPVSCVVYGHGDRNDACQHCLDKWRRRAETAEHELSMALEREEARRR